METTRTKLPNCVSVKYPDVQFAICSTVRDSQSDDEKFLTVCETSIPKDTAASKKLAKSGDEAADPSLRKKPKGAERVGGERSPRGKLGSQTGWVGGKAKKRKSRKRASQAETWWTNAAFKQESCT